MCLVYNQKKQEVGDYMKRAEEIYRIIMHHSALIRESLGDSKFVHGEIYADMVFGALLSAADADIRKDIADIAFEKYRSSAAMCVSLERESLAAEAMNTACEKGISEAVRIHLGVAPDEKLIYAFLNEID